MSPHATTVVAIPVCNEVERIGACLEALDSQVDAQLTHIALLLNNCTDGTRKAAQRIQLRPGTTLHCIERDLAPGQASAGHARRLAMQAGAALAQDGVLLTTDADARVDPDWLAANLAAMHAGAELVAGWVELDAVEWGRIPVTLHQDNARECAYDVLCDEIHALLDPDPADPWPRHTQHSGASLAVTMQAYRRTDGVPDLRCGEDRAFVAALRRVGTRIRHAPEVHVTVSGRVVGRAAGGMADTIRRRLIQPDCYIDERLEPAWNSACRAFARGSLRRAYAQPDELAELARFLGLPDLHTISVALPFEAAWEMVEAGTWLSQRCRVSTAHLTIETGRAVAILADIKAGTFHPGDPAGRAPPVARTLVEGQRRR